MISRAAQNCSLLLLSIVLFATPTIRADEHHHITPQRLYNAIDRPIPISISHTDASELSLQLIDPAEQRILETVEIKPGKQDLAALFPSLWESPRPRILLLQTIVDGAPRSAPLILQPMLSPIPSRSAWSARVIEAVSRRDVQAVNELLNLTTTAAEHLREDVVLHQPTERLYSGLRIYRARTVTLSTDLGDISLRLYPEHAPETVFRFLHLVEGGYYDNLTFHRVVTTDHKGEPFLVQTGDPTSTGRAGVGAWSDFEANDLPHTFGVVSVARKPHDPNTNAGQFFICLSRDGCYHLDGRNTPFARVIDGADTLRAIALRPTTNRDPDDPTSPADRPIEPVIIQRAFTTPSPAWPHFPDPLEESDAYPRSR